MKRIEAEKGKIYEALEYSKRALEINPNFAWALFLNGYLNWFIFDYVESISYLNKAIKIEMGTMLPVLQELLYFTYWAIGFPDAAESHLNDLISLTGDSASLYSYMSSLESLRGNTQKETEYSNLAYDQDSFRRLGIIAMADEY